jgi:type VI secretion system protein VasI
MIRHKEGDLEVYITFRDYLGSDTTMVTMRLGTSPASQSKWGVSTDGKAIFYPADNNEFVKQLLENERLVIRLTPYGESPITSTFDLKGLKEAIEPMKGLIR